MSSNKKTDRYSHIWKMPRKKARIGFEHVYVYVMFMVMVMPPALTELKAYALKYYGVDAMGVVTSVRRVGRSHTTDRCSYLVWIGGERIECHSYLPPHCRCIGDSLSFRYLKQCHKICMPSDEIHNATLPDPVK